MKLKTSRKKQSNIKQRQWQAHIHAWRKSGLTQNEYCRQRQLSNSQFCYWKKKLKQLDKSSVSFVPVPTCTKEKLADPIDKDSGVTIILTSGVKIKLSNTFNPGNLADAVSVLGGRI